MREYDEDIHDELIPCSVEFFESVVAVNNVRLEHIPVTSEDQIAYAVHHHPFPFSRRLATMAMAMRMTKMPPVTKKRGRHLGYSDQASKRIP
jgi:hypothetical protein